MLLAFTIYYIPYSLIPGSIALLMCPFWCWTSWNIPTRLLNMASCSPRKLKAAEFKATNLYLFAFLNKSVKSFILHNSTKSLRMIFFQTSSRIVVYHVCFPFVCTHFVMFLVYCCVISTTPRIDSIYGLVSLFMKFQPLKLLNP